MNIIRLSGGERYPKPYGKNIFTFFAGRFPVQFVMMHASCLIKLALIAIGGNHVKTIALSSLSGATCSVSGRMPPPGSKTTELCAR